MTRRFRTYIALACALASALLCLAYGQHVEGEAERVRSEALERYGGEVVSIVVATEAIEAGQVVSEANAAERDWVAELAPLDAITTMDEVAGSEVSVPVAAGVPLTALNFRDAEDAVEVPAGRVALSVSVGEDLGLPPGAAAGDTLAAFSVTADGVRLIADDVRVLARAQSSSGLLSTGTLTVAVDPEDVAPMLAASGSGALRLALPGEGALGISEAAPTAPTDVAPEAEGKAGEGADGADAAGAGAAGGDAEGVSAPDADAASAGGEHGGEQDEGSDAA